MEKCVRRRQRERVAGRVNQPYTHAHELAEMGDAEDTVYLSQLYIMFVSSLVQFGCKCITNAYQFRNTIAPAKLTLITIGEGIEEGWGICAGSEDIREACCN